MTFHRRNLVFSVRDIVNRNRVLYCLLVLVRAYTLQGQLLLYSTGQQFRCESKGDFTIPRVYSAQLCKILHALIRCALRWVRIYCPVHATYVDYNCCHPSSHSATYERRYSVAVLALPLTCLSQKILSLQRHKQQVLSSQRRHTHMNELRLAWTQSTLVNAVNHTAQYVETNV